MTFIISSSSEVMQVYSKGGGMIDNLQFRDWGLWLFRGEG